MSENFSERVRQETETLDFKNRAYQAILETSKGTIRLDLWPDVAPGHVGNFIGLIRAGFYDGLTFHRVVPGFVIQAGCPHGNGTGGPGYTINAEFNDRLHEPGVISMARTSDPHSGGSQFFLCLERVPHLDEQYTAFGKAHDKESLNTILEIGKIPSDGQGRPEETVKINAARIEEGPAS